MGEVKVTVSSNQPKSVSVKSNTVQHPITATPDLSQYYSNIAGNYADLAKDWAIKLDEAVEGNEYSAKYNAQRASNYKDEAQNISNTMTQNYGVYNSNLLSTKDSAVESINTNKTNAISEINSTKTSAVDEITTAETGAINAINTNKNTAINEINSVGKSYDNLTHKQITNCLLEVPQNIKLELNNGILTLKAGSKVIVPNGFEEDGVTPRFDYVTVDSDISYSGTVGTSTRQSMWFMVADDTSFTSITGWGERPIGSQQSGTTTPSTVTAYYNTNENLIHFSGTTNTKKASLPLCIITLSNGVLTSIDQVFNGIGYIGSTVFVDKGVKGLIPNGRNEDGSLKNIEFTVEKIRTLQCTHTSTQYLRINGTSSQIGDLVYLEDKNWNTKDGEYRDYMVAGSVTANSGVITSLDIKQPFRAVDYADYKPAIDSKVSKSGDTMTGTLDIKKPNGQNALNIHTDGMVGSSGEYFNNFCYLKDNKGFATLRGSYYPSSNKTTFNIYLYDVAAGTSKGGISLVYDATNGLRFEFPRCTTKATTTSSAANNRVAVVVQNYVNGASWYRVWSDGWIEQGGATSASATQKSVSFIKSFSNTNITLVATDTNYSSTDVSACHSIGVQIRSTSKFDVKASGNSSVRWYACGY